MAGWRISGGIDATLPAVTLAPGAVLVVAADVGEFQATYAAVPLADGALDRTAEQQQRHGDVARRSGPRRRPRTLCRRRGLGLARTRP